MSSSRYQQVSEQEVHGLRLTHYLREGGQDPEVVLILLPGVGGFGLNFDPDQLYSSLAQEMTKNSKLGASVVNVDFTSTYSTIDHAKVVKHLADHILANISCPSIALVGWSYGGAVALELAHALQVQGSGRVVKGVVTLASQGASSMLDREGVVGVETLTAPLLFVAGTFDNTFNRNKNITAENPSNAVSITRGFEQRAIRSAQKSSLIVERAGHGCEGCKSEVFAWLQKWVRDDKKKTDKAATGSEADFRLHYSRPAAVGGGSAASKEEKESERRVITVDASSEAGIFPGSTDKCIFSMYLETHQIHGENRHKNNRNISVLKKKCSRGMRITERDIQMLYNDNGHWILLTKKHIDALRSGDYAYIRIVPVRFQHGS